MEDFLISKCVKRTIYENYHYEEFNSLIEDTNLNSTEETTEWTIDFENLGIKIDFNGIFSIECDVNIMDEGQLFEIDTTPGKYPITYSSPEFRSEEYKCSYTRDNYSRNVITVKYDVVYDNKYTIEEEVFEKLMTDMKRIIAYYYTQTKCLTDDTYIRCLTDIGRLFMSLFKNYIKEEDY